MDTKIAFGLALKKVRHNKSMTQEDFSDISSRTYMSTLERGVKSPTIEKVEKISEKLGVHPLTLYTLTYLKNNTGKDRDTLLNRVRIELDKLSTS